MRWELKVSGLGQRNNFTCTLVTGSKVFPSGVYALCPASHLCLEACLELPFCDAVQHCLRFNYNHYSTRQSLSF